MILLLTWIILLPWFFIPNQMDAFLMPRQLLFMVGGWANLVWMQSTGTPLVKFPNPWLKWLLLWIVGCFLLHFAIPMLQMSLSTQDLVFNWFVILPTFDALMMGLLVITMTTTFFSHRYDRCVQVTHVLCWSSVALAVYCLLQYLGCEQFFHGAGITWLSDDKANHMVGTMGNMSYVAMYLASTTPLFLLFRQKRYLIALGIVLICLALSGRKYGIGSGLLGLAIYGWLRFFHHLPSRRRLLLIVSLLSVVGGLAFLATHSALLLHNPRFGFWTFMGTQLAHRPLDGFGLGGFALQFFLQWDNVKHLMPALGVNIGSRWMWAHNDFWQVGYELGVVGMGLILLLVWNTLKRAWAKTATPFGAGYFACAIALLSVSLMSFPFHFGPTAAVGLLIWSMNEVALEGGG